MSPSIFREPAWRSKASCCLDFPQQPSPHKQPQTQSSGVVAKGQKRGHETQPGIPSAGWCTQFSPGDAPEIISVSFPPVNFTW
jgi:hypothetical protein